MPKEKVIHKKTMGPVEMVVSKEELKEDEIVAVDAGDVIIPPKPPAQPVATAPVVIDSSPPKKETAMVASPVEEGLVFIGKENVVWQCILCSDTFDNQDKLMAHIKKKHKVDPSYITLKTVETRLYRVK